MRRKFNAPTSYDVASRAGVSQAVVSRAFQADAPIAPATRERVLAAAQALGYQPNAVARSLITKRSGLVAILISQDTQRETTEVLLSLGLALQGHGFQPLLFTVAQESEAAQALARALAHGSDAVVSCLALPRDALERAWQRPCPVVMFNREAPADLASGVATDNRGAARLLASRLYAAGHRRFAIVAGPQDAPVARLREQGFCGRLAELGVTSVRRVAGDYHYESGHAAGLELLQTFDPAQRPQAIFCVNDAMAMGVLDAARFALMLQVPRDVSIVGFDDIHAGQRPAYRLTTVAQSFDALAARVADEVRNRLTDHAACTQVQLPAELVERASAHLFPHVA
ncbi:MAG: LacI family DNA-binding transcriptional regulator [Rhodoferax sp.]|nr:LacI family DNA-binding transcriptional regulator [Rhodoferax sp.]